MYEYIFLYKNVDFTDVSNALLNFFVSEFNITFNPDVFQPHVKHANEDVSKA